MHDQPAVQRFLSWVVRELSRVVDKLVRVVPGGLPSLVVVVAALVALVVLLRLGLGPTGLRDALTDRRRGAAGTTADEYRAEAESLAAQGMWTEAVRARFRAVARELEQRGVLDPRPGRTAGEIARESGAAVPYLAAELRVAAGTFDAVWYGDHPAGQAEYDAVRAADVHVRDARLVTA